MNMLLCLLSILVYVHSQTFPCISFMDTYLTKLSYINITPLEDNQDALTAFSATLTSPYAAVLLRVLVMKMVFSHWRL